MLIGCAVKFIARSYLHCCVVVTQGQLARVVVYTD